jgi:hypothetical protein
MLTLQIAKRLVGLQPEDGTDNAICHIPEKRLNLFVDTRPLQPLIRSLPVLFKRQLTICSYYSEWNTHKIASLLPVCWHRIVYSRNPRLYLIIGRFFGLFSNIKDRSQTDNARRNFRQLNQ